MKKNVWNRQGKAVFLNGLPIATASEVGMEAKVIRKDLDLLTFGPTKNVLTANFEISK